LNGAAAWLASGVGNCPVIERDLAYGRVIPKNESSATAFKFTFGQNSKVLATLRRLNAQGIAVLLQARTAFGFVGLPEIDLHANDWVDRANIEIYVDGERIPLRRLRYAYPHELVEEKYTLSLEDFASLDLSSQKKHRGRKKFIYTILPTDAIVAALEGHPDAEALKRLAVEQHVAAYVAFADQKATLDNINDAWYKGNPGSGRKAPIIPAGIQIATANMPVGEPLEVSLKYGTGNKNRVVAIVEFDNVKPDFGRKTFQADVKELAQAVVGRVVTGPLVKNREFLIPHDAPHGGTLTEVEEILPSLRRSGAERPNLPILGLALAKEPKYEQEVLGLFFALVATGRLPGYEILACPGSSSKYDAIVNFSITKDSNLKLHREIRVDTGAFPSANLVRFTEQVLEFKMRASELLIDFDVDVKRPRDIFMLVCWELGDAEIFDKSGVEITRLADHGDPIQIVGQTHVLEYSGHQIWVLCLRDVIQTIAAHMIAGVRPTLAE
jgi:hypothetical protein